MARASALAIIFCVIVLLESVAVVVLSITRMALANDTHTVSFGVILTVSSIFVVYFAVDGSINENKFTLMAFIAACLILLMYISYQFFISEETISDLLLRIRMIIAWVATPTLIGMAIIIYRQFGWRLYDKIGADTNLINLYKTYQQFTTFVRVDTQFFIMMLLMVGFFMLNPNNSQAYITSWEFYLDILGTGLNIGWATVGIYSVCLLFGAPTYFKVRHESPAGLLFFVITSFFIPLYLIGRFISLVIQFPDEFKIGKTLDQNMFILVSILGFLAIINRVLTAVWTWKCYKNFEKGLMDRVFEKENKVHDRLPLITG